MKVLGNGRALAIHGDTETVLDSQVKDASVDLIFADPPYNIGKKFADFYDKWSSDREYAEWCYRWIDICIRKLKPTGAMYLMTSTQAMPYLDLYIRDRMSILSRIVWSYDSSGVQAKRHYGSLWEPILFCVKDKNDYTFNTEEILVEAKTGAKRKLIDYRGEKPKLYSAQKIPGNVWEFPRVRYRMGEYENHPAQKPEALLERIVKAGSNADDLVLDPFAGTFTTCAVCQRFRRNSIGIELQEEYYKIGLRRLKIATEFDGEPLRPINKKYARKNGNRADDRQVNLL